MNDYCGPIYNRVPSMGSCLCPSNLVDSNGVCLQRCILNLKGRSGVLCYPNCPTDSYPYLTYDSSISAQERNQYDATSQTDCLGSSNHLRFKYTGKGLAVMGPPDMTQMPNELTIAFWVRPTQLNSVSYFVNAFNRITVSAASSNNYVFFSYKTSPTSSIQPVYNPTSSQRQISLNSWNYISVSIRTYLSLI